MSIKTIRITVDYHGADEKSHREDTEMTLEEMRSFMVWLSQKPISEFKHDNGAVAGRKIYRLLSDASHQITML